MADVTQANCSVKVRSTIGGFKFRTAQITSDGTGTTIPATLLDMNYIDHAIMLPQAAALCDTADYNYLTYGVATTIMTMAVAGSSSAVMDLMAWGW